MDFWTRMRKAVDKGLSVSRDWLGKAGDAARDLGEKGVLRLEIRELEAKSKDLLLKLGTYTYEQLGREKKASITAKNQEVQAVLTELLSIEEQVQNREQKIEALNRQEQQARQDSDPAGSPSSQDFQDSADDPAENPKKPDSGEQE